MPRIKILKCQEKKRCDVATKNRKKSSAEDSQTRVFFSSRTLALFLPSEARARERARRPRNTIYFSFSSTKQDDDGDAGDADGDEQLEI